MDSESQEWWRRHGWTIGLLFTAFGIAFALRTIWQIPIIDQFGALYTYAGGSDSYYHSRVMTYIIQTHQNLIFDPMLKYPIGAINPREPLFDWMNAVLGIVFAPAFGGNAINAGAWFLDLQAPLWAALAVFPIYLVGREISGRRTGLIAAFIYPFFAGSIDFTTFGYSDYQSFYTFLLLVALYAYLRTLKAVGHRRWVERSWNARAYLPALRGFLSQERTALKWAVFTGVALGAFALSWQGYTYLIVVIAFTALIATIIEQIRHVDSLSLYFATWIIGVVAFAMLSPYYVVQGEIRVFLELPIILYFGTLLLLLPFLLMRDLPWVFSLPALLAVVGVGVLALRFASPVFFNAAITGEGYFTKTLVYTTVAEAQAPSIDALVVSYGVVTFFLAFAGLALFGLQLVRQRFKRYLIALTIFAVISIYLPISASKFFPVAAPAFALLSAEGFHRLLDVGGYPQLRRSVASLSDRGSSFAAFRKSFKARHVLVLALAIGVLLPNIWIAMDAGIPSNTKDAAAVQINNTIPSWLKLNASAPASDYLGAAGSGLDTSSTYDSAGYNWLAAQDTQLPEPDRPAVVAWWDYGFQTIDQGQHPSVADNFQNGIDPAGQFLLSQNESLAIAVLTTALLQGELEEQHTSVLPTALARLLTEDGVNVAGLEHVLTDESADYRVVTQNPQTYLPVNPSTLSLDNAMYLASSYYLADHLSRTAIALVYDTVQAYTGWRIAYAMTDSRTFPFSGSDTGIYYAPADLIGRVVNSEGVPVTFFNVTITGSDGNTYPYGPLPADVSAVEYNINYFSPFYNSMLYRIYIGYNGTDAGQASGIPGLSGAAENDPIEPGWMLQHFEVEYETAYVCPGVNNASTGSGCFVPTNRPTAITIANKTGGTADLSAISYFEGGESILEYYSGVTLDGRLVLPDGQPDVGARVTVYDGWGIPHMTNVTGANGTFQLVLPPGNDTLRLSYGTLDERTESGVNVLASIPMTISDALGFDLQPQTMVQNFVVQNGSASGLVYWNATGSSSYEAGDPVAPGAEVILGNTTSGAAYTATTDASGSFDLPTVGPGIYNVTVRVDGTSFASGTANVSAGKATNLSVPLTAGSINGTVTRSGTPYAGATVILNGANASPESTTTDANGTYSFTGLVPGTYSVSASVPSQALTSTPGSATISSHTTHASVALTLGTVGSAEVEVTYAGAAVPNASVTLDPLPSFGSTSTAPLGEVLSASTNTTYTATDDAGLAGATVAVGRYTVEARAEVDGLPYTALAPLNVTSPTSVATVVLNLTPARTVTVALSGGRISAGSNQTAILAYAASGAESTAWVVGTGTPSIQLPDGIYTLLALQGSSSSNATTTAGLAVAAVTGSMTASVGLQAPARTVFTVGSPTGANTTIPAANASLTLSAGSGGPSLPMTASSTGVAGFVVPASPADLAGGYCLTASAFGFASTTTCGLTGSSLSALTKLPLTINSVPVTLTVTGLPSGTSVTANVTGESSGTESLVLSGGPTFNFDLTPGVYGVGAYAVIGDGTKVYLPSSVLSTTILLGATSVDLTLVVLPGINASGTLTVPAGLTLANTTVSLVSPEISTVVSGSQYVKQFRATPGTYTATVRGDVGAVEYVNVSQITVASTGKVTPRLTLATPGVTAAINLTSPSGAIVPANTTVRLVNGAGLAITKNASSGSLSVVVPPGTYRVVVNASVATAGPNGSYVVNWTSSASAACSFSAGNASCNVPMVGTVEPVAVRGTLAPATGGAPVTGSVELVGPYPSTNVTVVDAPSGTFAASVMPGAYDVYAVSSASPTLAAFDHLLALPGLSTNLTIAMAPTWTDELRLGLQSGTGESAGPVNVTVRNVFGISTVLAVPTLPGAVDIALPYGTYVVSASSPGTLNGVASTANASARVKLIAGNAVTDLDLAVAQRATVAGTLLGSGTAQVAAGGSTTFDFTVRNTGNVPVTVRPVGGPSTWGFDFSFANVTLAPGANASGEVRVHVPAGTLVDHAPMSIEFELSNGTGIGEVAPTPTVNVLPYYGLTLGTSSSNPPDVGPTRAVLPFYVIDSGNTRETVLLTDVSETRLTSEGWNSNWIVSGTVSGSDTINLAAAENTSVSVNLTAMSSSSVGPGTVVVQVTVLNGTGGIVSSVDLAVPHPGVGTSPGTLHVTGPGVTSGPSAIPDWFVPLVSFVPVLALIAVIALYRWWRTRRWTRW